MSQSKKRTRSRNYCFTDFELLDWNNIWSEYKDIIRYICIGEEECPTTNKKHYQGWIQFKNPKSLITAKKIIDSKKIHLEICKGNQHQNDTYCKKDNKFKSWGQFVSQGQRTDLETIKKLINEGKQKSDIIDNHFETYCRYRKGILDAIQIEQKKRRAKFREIEVEFVHGNTGTGKTRYAMQHSDVFKIHGSDMQWWDGYDGEKTLVIDEYANDIKITKLLGICDGYQLRLPIKGGHTYANWNKIIITSNLNPSDLHNNAKDMHRQALFRRITKIISKS